MDASNQSLRYFLGADWVITQFLAMLRNDYRVLDGKFRIAGIYAGGISAFPIAAVHPEDFWSVTAFPGSLRNPSEKKLDRLTHLCLYMFVGALDEDRTRTTMQTQADLFRAWGFSIAFSVEPDEEHVIEGLIGAARLLDQFDAARSGRCEQ